MAQHPNFFGQFVSVIELGSGTGLVGILASMLLGAGHSECVVLTDHDPRVRFSWLHGAIVLSLDWKSCIVHLLNQLISCSSSARYALSDGLRLCLHHVCFTSCMDESAFQM